MNTQCARRTWGFFFAYSVLIRQTIRYLKSWRFCKNWCWQCLTVIQLKKQTREAHRVHWNTRKYCQCMFQYTQLNRTLQNQETSNKYLSGCVLYAYVWVICWCVLQGKIWHSWGENIQRVWHLLCDGWMSENKFTGCEMALWWWWWWKGMYVKCRGMNNFSLAWVQIESCV